MVPKPDAKLRQYDDEFEHVTEIPVEVKDEEEDKKKVKRNDSMSIHWASRLEEQELQKLVDEVSNRLDESQDQISMSRPERLSFVSNRTSFTVLNQLLDELV